MIYKEIGIYKNGSELKKIQSDNDLMCSDRQSLAISAYPDQRRSLIRVFTVCNLASNFLKQCFMVKDLCSSFKEITASSRMLEYLVKLEKVP